jgi:hypothetical protein
MKRNNFANKASRAKTGVAGWFAKVTRYARYVRYVRYGGNIVEYAKLMLQPPRFFVKPLPRSEWLNVAPDPDDISGFKLAGARPTSLRPQSQTVSA